MFFVYDVMVGLSLLASELGVGYSALVGCVILDFRLAGRSLFDFRSLGFTFSVCFGLWLFLPTTSVVYVFLNFFVLCQIGSFVFGAIMFAIVTRAENGVLGIPGKFVVLVELHNSARYMGTTRVGVWVSKCVRLFCLFDDSRDVLVET